MYFVYILGIAIMASIALFIIASPYLEGRTRIKKKLGLLCFFTLYVIQDIYMIICFPIYSDLVNFLNCISYYAVQWLILHFFFKKRSFIELVMIFAVDFLVSALDSLVFAFGYGFFTQYDFTAIEVFTDTPSIKSFILGVIGQVVATLTLIPIVKIIVQKQNLIIHIIATILTIINIIAGEINNPSSIALVLPVFTIAVVAGFCYQEWEILKEKKMTDYYKKLEDNQALKKEELQQLKEDVLAHLQTETNNNEYAGEILKNIEERLNDI